MYFFTDRWLVLERCIGDLENMLSQVKETTESKRILVQVAVGLAYLHGQRIVHRDLKPQIILVQRSASSIFVLKLADFGFSKKQQLGDDGKFSFDDTQARGTSGYMAPEVLDSSNPKKHFESDVWALGVVFYYVLSDGKHPLGERILISKFDMRDTIIQLAKDLRQMGPISHD
jgi:serine/threonine protein kinase